MPNISVSTVMGNAQKLDGGSMFGNVPRALWERWYQPDERGRIDLACRALLIEVDQTKILVEAGIGAFMEPKMADRFGVQDSENHRLLDNLDRLDISHEDIDFVVLSHLHFDHAGGILPTYFQIDAGRDDLLFPNAWFIVGKEAFERSQNPHMRDKASFIPGLDQKLMDTGRLVLVEGDRHKSFFEDRARFVYSHGHTPGQMHLLFEGNTSKIFFAGDLIPGRHWVHLPVTMGYDRYPEKLIDEKASLYHQAMNEEWMIFYTHDHEVCCSQILMNDKGKFESIEEMTELERWRF